VKLALLVVCLALCAGVPAALAQEKVDLRNTHERVICVVPMIGAGTMEDPRRPMYAPKPGDKADANGIIAFTYQLSDDGKSAIVEFVARDRAALEPILKDKDARFDVKVFERGKGHRDLMRREFQKHKRDFDPDQFGIQVP